MFWIIGKILTLISNLCIRFRSKYILHSFAEHGEDCHIDGGGNFSCRNISLGNNVFIGPNATFVSSRASIYIGSNVMFGPNVMIATGNHRIDVIGELMSNVKEKRKQDDEDVIIEDDCWIGMGVIILKGVKIGKGSVVGAGAIITCNIPPYSIATAKTELNIRPRFNEENLEKHINILSQKYNK